MKRFVRIVDHTEKEVIIFDNLHDENLFNIFFNELDSAICLDGALRDTVDLLNKQSEELANEYNSANALTVYKSNVVDTLKDYSKFFKRHSKEFSFMMDLAEDLGVDVRLLEANDD